MAIEDSDKDELALEAGKRIRRAREARKWSQKQLAEATGYQEETDRQPTAALKPSAIGNYEQGTRRVGWEEAVTIAAIFNEYPPAYYMAVITEDEARVIHAMRHGQRKQPVLPFPAARPAQKRTKGKTP